MSETAKEPGDLARLFHARANAGDVEGLVALYEPEAVLAAGEVVATATTRFGASTPISWPANPTFPPLKPAALRNGDLGLTFARLPNGSLSVEAARRQPDGRWLWAIDQLKIRPAKKD